MENEISVGDWIRFYKDNTLVIGVVCYIINLDDGNVAIATDIGVTSPNQIAEVRSKENENE